MTGRSDWSVQAWGPQAGGRLAVLMDYWIPGYFQGPPQKCEEKNSKGPLLRTFGTFSRRPPPTDLVHGLHKSGGGGRGGGVGP